MTRLAQFVATLTVAAGCIGEVADGEAPAVDVPRMTRPSESGGPAPTTAPATPGAPTATPGSAPRCDATIRADPAPLRLLTPLEYNNTVRDLLGDASAPLVVPPGAQGVSPALTESYMDIAERLAAKAVGQLDRLLGCQPQGPDAELACVRAFIQSFGRRAFRHAVDADEAAALLRLFTASRPSDGFAGAVELVVQGILQSPQFLYHVELGSAPVAGRPDVTPLSGDEMASRLSYFLWGTMPDDALARAAAAGSLGTLEGIAAQAQRMLDDPRAHATVARFHAQWLGLDQIDAASRDGKLFPQFTAGLRDAMKKETLTFLDHHVWEMGDVAGLFVAGARWVNPALAALYGLPAPAGTDFTRIGNDPAQHRPGLLTHASLLAINAKAATTSPVHRGLFVRESLLCQTLPPPPADVPPLPENAATNSTERERLAQHRAVPACAGCHGLLEPIGFALEGYDAIGRFRTMDGGRPVDSSGQLVGTTDADGPLADAVDLSRRLAQSQDTRACVTKQWYRYALGRRESDADSCVLARVDDAIARGGYRVRDLIVAITQADTFRYRQTIQKGVCQ
jgi:hypothetical protein